MVGNELMNERPKGQEYLKKLYENGVFSWLATESRSYFPRIAYLNTRSTESIQGRTKSTSNGPELFGSLCLSSFVGPSVGLLADRLLDLDLRSA